MASHADGSMPASRAASATEWPLFSRFCWIAAPKIRPQNWLLVWRRPFEQFILILIYTLLPMIAPVKQIRGRADLITR